MLGGVPGFEFTAVYGYRHDSCDWKAECKAFLLTLTEEMIPLPESGDEEETLQQLGEWSMQAFLETQDPRNVYLREFLTIEVRRVKR